MTSGLRVGIAGVGAMGARHAEAVLDAGGSIAAALARPGSPRAASFVERFGVATTHDDVRSFAAAAEDWDAIIVAVATEAAAEMLPALVPTGVPLLIEKPGATTSDQLTPFLDASARILVGYNRRFYAPVRAARRFVRDGNPVIATLTLPEKLSVVDGAVDPRPFLENAVHALDLLRHLLGPLEVASVSATPGATTPGLVATLTSDRGDVVSLVSAWGTPANFALDLARGAARFELRPFEVGRRFEGMTVQPPEPGIPIKRYLPTVTEQISLEPEDERCKPGFRQQIDALGALVAGEPTPVAARLVDAVAALRLAETLLRDAQGHDD